MESARNAVRERIATLYICPRRFRAIEHITNSLSLFERRLLLQILARLTARSEIVGLDSSGLRRLGPFALHPQSPWAATERTTAFHQMTGNGLHVLRFGGIGNP